MSADIPTTEPATLRAGDTWRWTKTLADYPAGTWTLKYRFKNASSGFEIVCTASGTDHAAAVTAAVSATIGAGTYAYVGWVEGGTSEKYTVVQGEITVLSDLRAGTASDALDARSHAAKTLAALEAWIERHEPAVAEYEIAGRRMKYIPIGELMKLRSRYQQEVAAEQAAAKLAAGIGGGRRIQVRI